MKLRSNVLPPVSKKGLKSEFQNHFRIVDSLNSREFATMSPCQYETPIKGRSFYLPGPSGSANRKKKEKKTVTRMRYNKHYSHLYYSRE